MLLGRDADTMKNLHRDRSSSFHIGQIEDDYETEPLIATEQFYKRIRGKKGAFPPIKKKKKGKNSNFKTPVYACASVDELTTIDTKSNTFTVRLSLLLIFDIDISKTTARLAEELAECDEGGKEMLREERARKQQQWTEIVENALEDGTPYKIEDEEYEVFEEEIEWPESLELFNQITADQTEDPQFVILRTYPESAKEPDEVETATIWMQFMEGLYECKEYQELEFFPFDLQDLSLDFQLTTRADIDKFDFRLHTVEFYRPCLQMAEWTMYPPESDRKGTAKTSVRLRATRKPRYYITNIVGMMCILNCMCIAAFGIEVPDIADRLSVTMTMMLTAVAFKFIVGDQLPKVSYNTYLDFYLLYTMFFMFMCSIYFCFGPHLWKWHFDLEDIGGDPGEPVVQDVKDADRIVCYVLSAIFLLFTGYWFWGAFWIVNEISEELPPPINLEEGVEYISYRWQKVPFKGFKNPQSERERAGRKARSPFQPENIDRLEISPLSLESGLSYSHADSINGVGVTVEDRTDAQTDFDLKVNEVEEAKIVNEPVGGANTEMVNLLPKKMDPATSDAHSPSTFEIEEGTLPAALSDVKIGDAGFDETPVVSDKRGPESPPT